MIGYMLSMYSVLRTECDNVEILIYLVPRPRGYKPEISASKLSRFPPLAANHSIRRSTYTTSRVIGRHFFPLESFRTIYNLRTTYFIHWWRVPKHISVSVWAPTFPEAGN